jgi:hypothetical protein
MPQQEQRQQPQQPDERSTLQNLTAQAWAWVHKNYPGHWPVSVEIELEGGRWIRVPVLVDAAPPPSLLPPPPATP